MEYGRRWYPWCSGIETLLAFDDDVWWFAEWRFMWKYLMDSNMNGIFGWNNSKLCSQSRPSPKWESYTFFIIRMHGNLSSPSQETLLTMAKKKIFKLDFRIHAREMMKFQSRWLFKNWKFALVIQCTLSLLMMLLVTGRVGGWRRWCGWEEKKIQLFSFFFLLYIS